MNISNQNKNWEEVCKTRGLATAALLSSGNFRE
jgi:hypothetical protein